MVNNQIIKYDMTNGIDRNIHQCDFVLANAATKNNKLQ